MDAWNRNGIWNGLDTMTSNDPDHPGLSSEEVRENGQTTRRNYLEKTAGLGAFALVPSKIIGNGPGGRKKSSAPKRPDTSFSPNRKSEARKFVKDSFEHGQHVKKNVGDSASSRALARRRKEAVQERRRQVLDDLSEDQKAAIEEVLSDGQIVLSMSTEQSGLQSSDSESSLSGSSTLAAQATDWDITTQSVTVHAEYHVPYLGSSYPAFDCTHEVTWEYNSDDLRVRNVDPRAYGDGKKHYLVYWEWVGSSRDDVSVRLGGNYFTSEKTGKFRGCVITSSNISCHRDDRSYTRVAGSSTGSFNLLDKEFR